MDLNQLRVFAATMSAGGFAAAARVLNEDASRVSRVIQSLEATLGVPLFHRTTRSMTPTEAARTLLSDVRPILEALDTAAERARDVGRGDRGVVRLSAPVSFTLLNVCSPLNAFLRSHPGITLDLHLHDGAPDLASGRYDLAITLGRPAGASEAIAVPLARMRNHVCASPEYLQKRGRPQSLADLSRHNCLVLDMPGFSPIWQAQSSAKGKRNTAQEVAVKGSLISSNALALRQAALDGLGVALLARWMVAKELEAGSLVEIFPGLDVTAADHPNPGMWLLRAPQAFTPKRVTLVFEAIKAMMSH
jgi:DNA-binding transcriptional LysR family regulator